MNVIISVLGLSSTLAIFVCLILSAYFTIRKDKRRNTSFYGFIFFIGTTIFLAKVYVVGLVIIATSTFLFYRKKSDFSSYERDIKNEGKSSNLTLLDKMKVDPIRYLKRVIPLIIIVWLLFAAVSYSISEIETTETAEPIPSSISSEMNSRYKKAAELQKKASNENVNQQSSESSASIAGSINLESEKINDDQLKASLDKIIIEYGNFINNIEPFDNDWKHVKVHVIDDIKSLTREEREVFVESSVPDIKGPIMGNVTDGDSDIRFTFIYSNGETMAESTVMDNSEIKVK